MTSVRTLFMTSTLIFWNAVGYYAVRCPTKPVCETTVALLPGSRIVTADELATHAKVDDCWVAIHDKVYSIAPFQDVHPGDSDLMKKYCGKNATDPYAVKESGKEKGKRHSPRADEFLEEYLIGKMAGK